MQAEALIAAQKGGMVRDMLHLMGMPERFKHRCARARMHVRVDAWSGTVHMEASGQGPQLPYLELLCSILGVMPAAG